MRKVKNGKSVMPAARKATKRGKNRDFSTSTGNSLYSGPFTGLSAQRS
jgi:hypothetical protein